MNYDFVFIYKHREITAIKVGYKQLELKYFTYIVYFIPDTFCRLIPPRRTPLLPG